MGNGKGDRFRELLKRPELLVLPGGFSPMMAKMVEEIGFDTFFMAGSHTSSYVWGLPDAGLITMREMVDHARRVADGCTIPVVADADTGFGNALNVYRTVREYAGTGVAAITIEDQEAPKKGVGSTGCISVEEAVGKYQAAVAARAELDSDLVIIARCDFIRSDGGSFDGAVERCIRYVEEGGADAVWMTGIATREEVTQACRRIPAPVLPGYAGPPPSPTTKGSFALAGAMRSRCSRGGTGLTATDQTQDIFRRFDAELREMDLSLGNTVRTRLWGRDRESRDLGSREPVNLGVGRQATASSTEA